MKETLFKEKYPIHTLNIAKSEAKYESVETIINAIQTDIQAHPVATYIGRFDHYGHTSSLSEGEISAQICDAKNIIFCFGKELMDPMVLAVRPRSIGVADMGESFILSFLEAPNPAANQAMIAWCKALLK